MFLSEKVTVFIIIVCASTLTVSRGKTIFCSWGTWSHYWPGLGNFEVQDIDPQLCTHIGYAFFGITEEGVIDMLDSALDFDLQNIENFAALKHQNRNLKLLVSVGGWFEGSAKYSSMASDPVKRANFIDSVVAFLKKYDLNGMDLHWKYPAQRGGEPSDRVNYITLLKELKAAFKPDNDILTAGVGPAEWLASKSYNIREMSRYLDLINVLTYDFHGPWNNVLGHNAPLKGEDQHTVTASINYWLSQGAPRSKLVMGIPFYARSFVMPENKSSTVAGSNSQGSKLAEVYINEAGFLARGKPVPSSVSDNLLRPNRFNTSVGAPSLAPGLSGPYTNQTGYLAYNEICTILDDYTTEWDEDAVVPYAYKDNQWLSYDNVRSITEKINFIKQQNLAGAVVWTIETDDFLGTCGGLKFPLLRTIKSALTG